MEEHAQLSPPRIVTAANKSSVDGLVIVGARHFDACMRAQIAAAGREGKEFQRQQGFIDQHCKYYDRKAAWLIAEKNGQIRNRCGGDGPNGSGLFSENLH